MSEKTIQAKAAILNALTDGYKMSIKEIDSIGSYPRAIEIALARECCGIVNPHHTQHCTIATVYKNLYIHGTLTGDVRE